VGGGRKTGHLWRTIGRGTGGRERLGFGARERRIICREKRMRKKRERQDELLRIYDKRVVVN